MNEGIVTNYDTYWYNWYKLGSITGSNVDQVVKNEIVVILVLFSAAIHVGTEMRSTNTAKC